MLNKEQKRLAALSIALATIKQMGLLNNIVIEDTDIDEECVKHLADSMEALSEGAIQYAKLRRNEEANRSPEGAGSDT